MNNQDFTKTFLDLLKPNQHVLDLGAGEGKFSRMFLERGTIVTAVDIRIPKQEEEKFRAVRMKIEDYCNTPNTEKYNRFFLRNVIQFLDKNWVFEILFPWIENHSSDSSIVAIETFYQDPEPPFDHPMRSLYSLDELTLHFMTWVEHFARQYSHMGLDMGGQTRKFFLSSLIVQKP
ncbi:MAG: SAM-dependent methyltransferase [Patescibacteria group bacterium]